MSGRTSMVWEAVLKCGLLACFALGVYIVSFLDADSDCARTQSLEFTSQYRNITTRAVRLRVLKCRWFVFRIIFIFGEVDFRSYADWFAASGHVRIFLIF